MGNARWPRPVPRSAELDITTSRWSRQAPFWAITVALVTLADGNFVVNCGLRADLASAAGSEGLCKCQSEFLPVRFVTGVDRVSRCVQEAFEPLGSPHHCVCVPPSLAPHLLSNVTDVESDQVSTARASEQEGADHAPDPRGRLNSTDIHPDDWLAHVATSLEHTDDSTQWDVPGAPVDVVLIAQGDRHARMAITCIKSVIFHSSAKLRFWVFTDANGVIEREVVNVLKETAHGCATCTVLSTRNMNQEMEAMSKSTGFSTSHYSGIAAMQKLLIDKYLPKDQNIGDFVVLDADIIFTDDIAKFRHIAGIAFNMQAEAFVAMPCHTDPKRVQSYCTDTGRQHNCHKTLYCTSAPYAARMSRLAAQNFSGVFLVDTMRAMVAQYGRVSYSVSDQEIFNRIAGTNPQFMSVLPHRWTCNSHDYDAHNESRVCHLLHYIGSQQKTWKPYEWNKYSALRLDDVARGMKCD